ncbi:hypothetical protein SAMN05216174_101133 [Actinokineospora iranica]|uniref:PknH-like extracellular domain-containing protein n=1 Tax=Actinokineospora iranica TaxID=1271860 RepID=A0A1G6IWR8_9PSEU|nr:hypothetical protein SAMN05216174_101133 [Actinokineospora iranica]
MLAAACATVLPVSLLAGCSDRPNDLYTYYDDAPPSATSAAPAQPSSAPAPTTAASSAAAAKDRAATVALGALTAADLAAEEVSASGAPDTGVPATLPDCGVRLGAASAPGQETTWKYRSGSMLRQRVAYAEDPTAVLAAARDALDCGAFQVDGESFLVDEGAPLSALPGVDDRLSWCASGPGKVTCTVLLARGNLVTAVTVESGTAARARSAVTRLAPKAAAALARGL